MSGCIRQYCTEAVKLTVRSLRKGKSVVCSGQLPCYRRCVVLSMASALLSMVCVCNRCDYLCQPCRMIYLKVRISHRYHKVRDRCFSYSAEHNSIYAVACPCENSYCKKLKSESSDHSSNGDDVVWWLQSEMLNESLFKGRL